MPSTLTLAANPLHLTSRSSVSLVATRPVSTSRASISAAASQPAVASSVSSLLASTPSVSTRPVSFPKKINWQHVTSASNPTMSTRPGSTPMVFSRPASTAVVSSRSASTAAVSSRLGSTAAVSTRPMSTAAVFTRPMSTAEVSIAAVSSRFVPTATRPTQPISSPKVSSGLVSTPLVSTARACTPIVSTPKVTARPMPTVTMSCRTVSIPDVSTRPLSFTKTFTPLVSSVSTQPVSSTMVRSMVTGQDTRPVSTPTVSIQPISIPKVITPLMSVPRVSGTTKSISMSPTTSVSASTVSTNPVPPSTVPITLVSAPVVTSLSKSLSSSVLSLFTRSSPGQNNQSSKVSSGSQEKESNSNDKVDIILEAPKGEESEQLYIYSADLQPPLRKDSSASLEHELCSFLENEHQYLNTLKRINDAKKVLTSELQNLLIGSDRLADFHNDLYRNLYQEFPSSSGIAQVFLSSKEELDQYRYYIMNAPQVASQLGQQTEIVQQHPDLEADIKSSWKRLHFYFMTFEKLVKIVPPEEQQLVQKVVDLLRETNRQGDSGILIDAVKGAPFNLHTLGPVVLHNLFHIKDSSGMLSSRMKYHVLLFEEMLVILLPKKEKYRYRDHLLLRQLNLLPQSNSDEATFVLELEQGAKKRKRKYTFRPRQQEAKAVWVAEFSRLLLKYEEEVERLRQLRWGNT
ncbi:hypothetical protein GWK47_013041 [Chionoecetes opilio]|uniref:SOS1/NGEF-like PH domain-containing protein n=1 Tax=Chionoecetes opilio TaxID=41210 RepID=A0A8J4XVR6_CHIOP|nr:hypothetical protein GWK47_013041 [Chionoecetes opilio]